MTRKPAARTAKPAAPGKRASPRTRAPTATKTPKPKKAKVRIFVSYCHANAAAQEKLQIHLAQLKRDEVETWFDGDMHAGDQLNTEIGRTMRAAHIFVALMSPEYIHSRWCQLEYKRAMGRRARGSMRVVVVIVRPCDWKETGASDLKVLPRDGRPVSGWRTADDAYNDVTKGIRDAVGAVRTAMKEDDKPKPARAARSTAAAARTALAKPAKGGVAGQVKAPVRPSGSKAKRPTRNRAAR